MASSSRPAQKKLCSLSGPATAAVLSNRYPAKERKKGAGKTKPPPTYSTQGRIYVYKERSHNRKEFVRLMKPRVKLRLAPKCAYCFALAAIFRGDHQKFVKSTYRIPVNLPAVQYEFESTHSEKAFETEYKRQLGQASEPATVAQPKLQTVRPDSAAGRLAEPGPQIDLTTTEVVDLRGDPQSPKAPKHPGSVATTDVNSDSDGEESEERDEDSREEEEDETQAGIEGQGPRKALTAGTSAPQRKSSRVAAQKARVEMLRAAKAEATAINSDSDSESDSPSPKAKGKHKATRPSLPAHHSLVVIGYGPDKGYQPITVAEGTVDTNFPTERKGRKGAPKRTAKKGRKRKSESDESDETASDEEEGAEDEAEDAEDAKEGQTKTKNKGLRKPQSLARAIGQIIRAVIKTLAGEIFYQLPAHNTLKLLPHQEGFLKWYLERETKTDKTGKQHSEALERDAVLLYAACSSGKTKAILQALSKHPAAKHVVITAAITLLDYWEETVREIWDVLNSETHFLLLGYNALQRLCADAFDSTGKLVPSRIPLEISRARLVLDEAEYRNALHSTAMLKTLQVLLSTKQTLLSTGTPLVNDPLVEFPSLLAVVKALWLDPYSEGTHAQFRDLMERTRNAFTQTLCGKEGRDEDEEESDGEAKLGSKAESKRKLAAKELGYERFPIPELTVLPPEVSVLIGRLLTGRVFFYDPKVSDPEFFERHFPKLQEIRRPVVMSWVQTLYYLARKRNEFRIGGYTICSPSGNHYGAQEKKISNFCREENKLSRKLETLCDDIVQRAREDPDGGGLVAKFKFVTEGLIPAEQEMLKRVKRQGTQDGQKQQRDRKSKAKLPTSLVPSLVDGKTPTKQRQETFTAYNNQDIRLLFLSSVGQKGVDLHGRTSAFFQVDQEGSIQDEVQSFNRIARLNPNRDFRREPPIPVYKYVVEFPKEEDAMSVEDRKLLSTHLQGMLKVEELDFDVERALRAKIKEERLTIDEIIEKRNEKKHPFVLLMLAAIQTCGKWENGKFVVNAPTEL